MRLLSRLAAAAFILALPVFLITSNVRFLATDAGFYRHGFREFHADQVTGVAMPELDGAANEIISYFEDDSTMLHIIVTQDGQEVSLFNTRETLHMKDVKSLMQTIFRANEVSLAVVLTYVACVFLWARERSFRTLAVQSLLGVALGLATVGIIGGFALAGFDSAWIRFHEIVFNNNLWELNPATDHLIQMFPDGFWQEATFIVAALTLGEMLLIVLTAAGYLIATHTRSAKATKPSPASTAQASAAPPVEQ